MLGELEKYLQTKNLIFGWVGGGVRDLGMFNRVFFGKMSMEVPHRER